MAIAEKITLELIQDKDYDFTELNAVGQTTHSSRTLPGTTGTCYVSKSGSDSNSGLVGNPVLTLAKANSLVASSGFTKICLNSDGIWTETVNASSNLTDLYSGEGYSPQIAFIGNTIGSDFIESLSNIDRKIFQEYNGNFYQVYSSGLTNLDKICYSSGSVFPEIYDNSGNNFLCSAKSDITAIAGAYFGNDNGKIVRFMSPVSSGIPYNSAGEEIRGLSEYNGYMYAASSGVTQKLIRTADGVTFSSVTTNFGDLALGVQSVRAIAEFDNKLVVAFDYTVLSSNDGATFTSQKTFDYGQFTAKKLIEFKDYLYICGSAGGVWRTNDLASWTKVLDGTVEEITINEHLYVITTAGKFYRSKDGTTFTNIYDAVSANAYIGVFNGLLYMGDTRYNAYLLKLNSSVTINNICFNTNLLDYAVYGNNQNLTLKWVTGYGFENYIFYLCSAFIAYNASFYSSWHGCYNSSTLDIQNSLFYDIDEKAVYSETTNISFVHNTLYDVNYGLYLTGVIISQNVKDNIFYFCKEYGIYTTYYVTLYFSAYSRAKFSNVILASSLNVNPLFVSTDSNNFKLKTVERGFEILQSPCKEAASDDKDMGCYDVSYTALDKEAIEIELDSLPSKFSINDVRHEFNSTKAISGNRVIQFMKVCRTFDFSWDTDKYVSKTLLYKFLEIFNHQCALWYKPSKQAGYIDGSGTCIASVSSIKNFPRAMLYLKIKNPNYQIAILTDDTQNWEIGKWRGWTVTFDGQDYRILYNDGQNLFLDTTATGAGNYKIEKIKVRIDGESLKGQATFYDGLQGTHAINGFAISFVEVTK